MSLTSKNCKNRVDLAGIQYVGEAGCTQQCLYAVMQLLQCSAQIASVRILTATNRHCLLLTIPPGELIAVKSGFTSGYGGEGPHGFSRALCVLHMDDTDFSEFEVDSDFIERVDTSSLTQGDIDSLDILSPVRPSRRFDYIFERDLNKENDGTLWRDWLPVIPFAIIDSRIFDLAKTFWRAPDDCLMTGYRRLEDIVRKRTGIEDFGASLFSAAFRGVSPKLYWTDCNGAEHQGRASLFAGTFMAYRNPRAHRQIKEDLGKATAEFLLLNHLYTLEADAVDA